MMIVNRNGNFCRDPRNGVPWTSSRITVRLILWQQKKGPDEGFNKPWDTVTTNPWLACRRSQPDIAAGIKISVDSDQRVAPGETR